MPTISIYRYLAPMYLMSLLFLMSNPVLGQSPRVETKLAGCHEGKGGEIKVILSIKNGDFLFGITEEPNQEPSAYQSSPTFQGLEVGWYNVYVKEADMQCSRWITYVEIKGTEEELVVDVGNKERKVSYSACDDPPPITLNAIASGGIPPYEYSWENGQLEVNSSGNYTVIVTDSIGCTAQETVQVSFTPEECSKDPNDILGPKGVGDKKWVSKYDQLAYTIRFENDPVLAKVSAQLVKISHPLSNKLDIFSLRLGGFGFGGFSFAVPPDRIFYQTRLDVADSLGVLVDITAGIDVSKKEAFWILESIDPSTGLSLTDASLGFLPVNDTITRKGEGFVSYTIKAGTQTKTGDVIEGIADIIFDSNEPIVTPKIFNTIDALAPSSTATVSKNSVFLDEPILISATGMDDPEGSGIGSFNIYVSGGVDSAFTLLAEGVAISTSYEFTPEVAGIYCFYTIAKDLTGNTEEIKSRSEACVQVGKEASLTLLSPLGGDSTNQSFFCKGNALSISWQSTEIAAIDIFYTNNEIDFYPIAYKVDPADSIFLWQVPDSLFVTEGFKIKVSDAGFSQLQAISPKPFTIVERPVVDIQVSAAHYCEGDTITLSAGEGFEGYLWSDESTNQNLQVTTSGVYTVTVKTSNGCSVSMSREIDFLFTPKSPLLTISGNSTRCEGDSIVLSAPGGYTSYRWNTLDTVDAITVMESGDYQVSVGTVEGCFSSFSSPKSIEFRALPVSPTLDLSGEIAICNGDSVTLSAITSYERFKWSNGQRSPSIKVKKSGDYFLQVTDSLGCKSTNSDTTRITIGSPPTEPFIGSVESAYCEGQEVSVDGPPGYTQYRWSNGSISQSIIVTENDEVALEVQDSIGCWSIPSDTLDIIFTQTPEKPIITVQDSTVLCEGESLVLYAPTDKKTYYWSTGLQSDSLVVEVSGNYLLSARDSLNCFSPLSEPVEVIVLSKIEQPVISAPEGTVFCEGDSIILAAPEGFDNYLWSDGAGTQSITVNRGGSFWVEISNNDNCNGSVRSGELIVSMEKTPAKPVISVEGSLSIGIGELTTLTGPAGFDNYSWSNGANTRTITVDAVGTFTLKVSTALGCLSPLSDEVIITAKPEVVTNVEDGLFNDAFGLVANPNPFNDQAKAHFRVPASGNVTIELFDLSGLKIARVFSGNIIAKREYKLSLSIAKELPDNVYLLTLVNSDGAKFSTKIIKRD